MAPTQLRPVLTPHGRLRLVQDQAGTPLEPALAARLVAAFDQGTGPGLLQLGGAEVGTALPPELSYWRELGSRYFAAVCAMPDAEALRGAGAAALAAPADLDSLARAAPPMTGGEYVSADALGAMWRELDRAFRDLLQRRAEPVQALLRELNPAWNLVGRVHFNLAENRKDPDAPFAFLATYTHRLTAAARAQHLPLGQALREYAGADDRERLLSLLLTVQRAAESCAWLAAMVERGEIFHPLRWSPREAFQLLSDVPALEAAGVVVRMPASWRGNRPPRPRVSATVGARPPSRFGADALLDFDLGVTLDGAPLTPAELEALLAGTDALAMVRGQWVQVDRERLENTLERFRAVERAAASGGIGFMEAMRLLAGADVAGEDDSAARDADWSRVVAGPWLAETLEALRSPEAIAQEPARAQLAAPLRPYQQVGVRWLHLLSGLGLGACLADDMGLGKTIQVLGLLALLRAQRNGPHRPSLLVAPASLLSNWAAEGARFAPQLELFVAHPSATPAEQLRALAAKDLGTYDLVVTSYGALQRLAVLGRVDWRLVVLDEAQAIKNPGTKQTRAAKALRAQARIALTGTPVENRLSDLWSLFDFINPGLLGTSKQFTAYAKRLAQRPHNPYGPLRALVRPYILRRLKTDRTVISDLPEKTELKAWCLLSRKQAALYQKAVAELGRDLKAVDGIKRKGVVLAFLMRFKQICNHPSHWLGDGGWSEADSGKLGRLREIGEVIAERQEKVLVFTQFREVTAPLATFLGSVFGRAGLVLHGETAVKQRKDLVDRFQNDESVPFFVLSLKAGGTGLNLTAASHVIHFDRWWNPAVENQATDRAFRIGQKRNVMVHKLVCRGTVEERIDELIESKRALSQELLQDTAGALLTEMKDEELLKLVALDLRAATEES